MYILKFYEVNNYRNFIQYNKPVVGNPGNEEGYISIHRDNEKISVTGYECA